MKILLTQNMIYLPTLNGAIKGNRALVEGLAARNMPCRVVTLAAPVPGQQARAEFLRELDAQGVREIASSGGVDIFHLHGVEVHAVADSAQLRAYLIEQIREFEPTWTLIPSEDPGQILLEAALKTSPGRVVFLAYTTQMLPCGPRTYLPSETRTDLLRQTTEIIALSHYLKAYIQQWSGCESVVLPAPVYGAGPFPHFGCFDQGFVTIVNPCRVKGISLFTDLARRLPNISFAAVPTWGTTDTDRANLAQLPNVQLLRPANDIDEILAQTRVLLVPSLWDEAFGMIVVEAMLRGIPVLASGVGGLPEAKLGVDYVLPVRPIEQYADRLSDRRMNAVDPEQDIAPWQTALERLLGDRAHYQQLSSASREAAHTFVSKLGIAPIEDFLKRLDPAARSYTDGATARPNTTSGDLPNMLENLSAKQRAFLALRLRQKEGQAQKQRVIPRRTERSHGPLSFAQQRLWFLDQMDRGTRIYNLPGAFRVAGQLNVPALRYAFDEIARRHEILRTSFGVIDERPAQIIAEPHPQPLPVVDLSGLPEAEREDAVRRLVLEEAQRPFDLARGPLARATVLWLGAQEYVLLLNKHHIIFDGWSIGIEIREFTTLYKSFCAGTTPALPALPIQYTDYAAWQREWLEGAGDQAPPFQTQLAYWKQLLGGAPAVLELPADRPRPAIQTFRGAQWTFALPLPLCRAIEELSRKQGVTVFMTLLAGFKVLLHRYTGQADIVVGSPIAGRIRPELHGLIGNFVNTLVLRTDLSGNPRFDELLGQVRERVLGAFAHQDLPFEKLVEELDPARSLSNTPLFQVVFGFQNLPKADPEPAGLSLRPLAIGHETAKVDMTVTIEEIGQGLIGTIQYNVDLFDEARISRMAEHYQQLLEGLAADPERLIADLPVLTEAERARVLQEWSATAPPTAPQLIHELLGAVAARTPEAPALRCGAQALTYAALDARANQLAHHLQALGVGPDTLVALGLPRSIDLIVALLATLKAGGAFLPLDLAAPPARLAALIADSGAPILLTYEALAEELPAGWLPPVCLDADAELIAAQPTTAPASVTQVEHLAYVIYTSGSTGVPKGVAVAHRGLATLVAAQAQAFPVTSESRVLQFASPAFDAAIAEILVTLGAGATLVLAEGGVPPLGPALLALLRSERITTVTLPPALLNLLDPVELPDLQTLVAAGEACPEAVVARWAVGRRFVNAYGPTEASVCASLGECLPGEAVTIGRPLAGSLAYVLDEAMQPLPIGVAGELYLGGIGLARGYLGRPDLTAERFVPCPWSVVSGQLQPTTDHGQLTTDNRLYRSGDRVRWRSDGTLEYLGRVDQQVKLRGFRIELGEIEAALRQHAAVQDAVVVTREDVPGVTRLVAYLVPSPLSVVSSQLQPTMDHGQRTTDNGQLTMELRVFLKQRLPEYMVPSAFVLLDALPLTPSGKVDRAALPVPDTARLGPDEAFVAPRTDVEVALARIWSEVLRLERVGVHDHFFELGGHSLLATQVITRVQDMFGVELPLRSLFEAATLAGMAAQIERARSDGTSAAPPLRPVPRNPDTGRGDQALPLSFAQQRLWFLDQLQPGSPAYNTPTAMRLRGALDARALRQGMSAIVARHEVLRTTFVGADGQPHQQIAPPQRVPMPLLDMRALPEQERETAMMRMAAHEAWRPFDLARGPLLRATLLRLGQADHVLLLTMHHIVSDAWSTGVLSRELMLCYAAAATGRAAALPALPVQYADYAVWQRDWLQGAGDDGRSPLQRQLAYWKQQLAGLPLLELPTDRPRPAVQTFRGASQSLSLSPVLSAELAGLAQREGVTVFMLLLAAFQLLLARYSGQDDVVVGTPIAGRTRAETEPLIGFFINTLALRTDLAGDPSFRELLGRVREVCLGAYGHQDLPFEQVVEALQPQRDLGRHPLFQVLFSFQAVAPAPPAQAGMHIEQLSVGSPTTKFDLSLTLIEGADGLRGVLEYATDLFDAATIGRMAGHFETLLAAIAVDHALPVSALPLLTEAERQQLQAWNVTTVAYPADACLHQLVAAQVARTPDAIALAFEGQQLTYEALDAHANQLAHHLQSLGVGPDTLVAVALERSLDLVLALLGVLKAGGAYLPLDPSYPAERLAFMLKDAQVSVLLTTDRKGVLHTPPADDARAHDTTPQPTVVALDADWPTIARQPATNPDSAVTPDNLAYVIYTSGSTGKPKGVQVTHANVVRLFAATQEWYHFDERDVWTLFHSYAFDFSVWEIWGALLYGGRLVVVSYLVSRSPEVFYELLADEQVTVLNQTPSAFRQLIRAEAAAPHPRELALRYVIFGGEALEFQSLRPWFERHGDARPQLVNMYGITETTVHVTYRPLTIADLNAVSGSVIGVRIPDLQVYVLDQQRQPVPIGVPGELYVGGAGVARGYLNRPELTDERFIPSPWSVVSGQLQPTTDPSASLRAGNGPRTTDNRLYKTGDLARFLPNGDIEYLGRLDQQVKLRGFRIELGEIEAVLRGHAAVREVAVMAREDVPGDKRLVAYLVTDQEQRTKLVLSEVEGNKEQRGEKPDSQFSILNSQFSELRDYLKTRLPDYMIPAAFVTLEALPLTPSGKLDRRALPTPDLEPTERAGAGDALRTPTEEVLAGIWSEVLRREWVGARDNFFNLGGHSLLATQVVARVRATFGVELALRALFEAPVLANFAARIEEARHAAQGLRVPPLRVVPRNPDAGRGDQALPLSFAQQRLWFLDQLQPGSPVYNLPSPVRLRGTLDVAALRQGMSAIVARHEVLRTTFVGVDGQPHQQIAPPDPVPMPLLDMRALPEQEREAVALRMAHEEARRPFDLARGPLLRATLLRLGQADHMLLLTMHHIVSDAWSTGVLSRELMLCYAAAAMGRVAALPALPVQYADYAARQRDWLQGEVLATQLGYWKRQLDGLTALNLPTDRSRPPVQTFQGGQQSFVLPQALSTELAGLAQREGVTAFMLLLAAFQVLLGRYSGQDDVVVGTPIAGRTQAETELLIGFFVNTLALRTDLSGDPTFRELLARVREACLQAYAHQELPFEQVVEVLQPDRDMGRHPLFQVMFAFLKEESRPSAGPILALQPLVVQSSTTKFDLSLTIAEGADGLSGTLEYATDLFDAATIGRMIGHFETLLAAIAVDHALPVSALPLLTEAERQQLQAWNATEVAYPPDLLLHQLVAAQVARTPDAIALMFDHQEPRTKNQEPRTKNQEPSGEDSGSQFSVLGSGQGSQFSILNSQFSYMTYAALDARANQLAHHLQSLGVGPDALVAVCLERSFTLVVALLGVLKAGGAYLPLDPSYPPERLAFMLSDSQAAVLLTTQEQRTKPVLSEVEGNQEQSADSTTERKGVLHTPPAHTPPANDGSAHSTTPPTHTPPANDGSAHSTTPPANPGQPTVVDLDADWETIARQPTTPPSSTATAAHLAYAIYTSGSTGQPKGALNAHQAIVNRLLWMQETYGLTASDHVLQKTPFSFDVSVWEFFWPLLAGARLVLARPEGHRDPAYLASLIEQTQITTLHFVPSMLRAFLEGADVGGCTSLRYVICSGEALSAELEAHFFAKLGAELHNLYGPTEAAVDVSAWACRPEPGATSVPIGRPIANTQLHILDRQMRVVPIGVTGELYIGGVQLARGYHHRPELTAERFVPNPFAQKGLEIGDRRLSGAQSPISYLQSPISSRLYRTGDLCRYREDGAIEYLGRIDHQVKLRGFRIELGEIEAALRGHAAVREAAVVAREDVPGDKRLVAYVVSSQEQRTKNKEQRGEKPDSQFSILNSQFSELRDYLKTRLPDYMIPTAFVTLEALPLTPSGKLDRRALPKPGHEPAQGAGAGEAPRTPAEEVLAGIWSEVLRVERVGARDHFFNLGGHSLLATQVVARVRATFGVELPLRVLFEAPLLADFAARIEEARHAAQGLRVPPLRRVARNPDAGRGEQELPLSFSQQRLWFLDQLEPNSVAYQMPFPVRLAGALDVAALRRSLGEIVRRHEALRTTFVSVDGRPVQVIAPARGDVGVRGGDGRAVREPPLPVVDLGGLLEDEREAAARHLGVDEVRRPFDLARGPLLRATLLRLGQADHVLLLNMHHIVSDGWSIGVLVRELAVLYEAFTTGPQDGTRSPLPALPIQYADYAAWQRDWLQGEALATQLGYWKRQLDGLAPLELPTDRPRPAMQTFRGGALSFELAPELSAALNALSRRAGCTLFMTLLAAFQALLARYSGQDDIVVGTFIANRHRPEVEGLIGFFVNNLVLRTDLSGDPTFRELLGRALEVCLGAYAHQDVPFELLLEELQPQRDLSRTPLFQVMVVLQNAPTADRDLKGLQLVPVVTESRRSNFDLTLWLSEEAQGITGMLEYSADLFDAATVERMLGHFQTLLEGIVADPDCRISALPLLIEAERRQLLSGWGEATPAIVPDGCVHRLFEAQAARTPGAVALLFDHQPPTTDRRPPTAGSHGGPALQVLNSQFSILNSQFSYATYDELNWRANQLAHHLRALGVGPEVRVAIVIERSLDLVVGVLGVLKAGGAYVPLDPAAPADRLAWMLGDAQARVVLTTEEQRTKNQEQNTTERKGVLHTPPADDERARRPALDTSPANDERATRPALDTPPADDERAHSTTPQPTVVDLLADKDCIAQGPQTNLDGDAAPGSLAYIVYTSGSTGRPKGVMVSHGSFVNAYLAWEQTYQLRPGAGHLQMANVAFDVFAGDLARALCSGGRLVLCSRELLLEAPELYALMRREAIDSAEFVPAVLRNLARYLEQTGQSLGFMRLLAVGSDIWHVKEHREIQRLCGPTTRLINSYGLSEATIDSSYFEGATHGMADDGVVPIGRPFANTRLYILDAHMEPVPAGLPGELYVGGAGLARGYLNRPDLTAERFVPCPWSVVSSQLQPTTDNGQLTTDNRLYRTGDLCRYRSDGNIEFLGRADYQVKLRGFRVELGEIEALLARHPDVREAVVVARKDVPGEMRLVAYVVADQEQRTKNKEQRAEKPDSQFSILNSQFSELRDYLKTHLPDYMIPAAFVTLDGLPLTPNGKIDRRALPAPAAAQPAPGDDGVAPRTPVEELVAQIWAQVLRLERVGAHDNFFALGGHSLLATQVIARLRELFKIDLPLRRLFEAPTVAELSAHVEIARRAGSTPVPPLRPALRDGALPLSFAQQRLWVLDQLEPNSPVYNIPLAVRLGGTLDIAALGRALNEIVRRHETLRTTFEAVDGRPVQVIGPVEVGGSDGGRGGNGRAFHETSLPLIDLRSLPDDEREAAVIRLAGVEGRRPFDLARGPLFRATLLRTQARAHVLLLTMHHIISDAWSVGVLVQEVAMFYAAHISALSAPLSALPIQYADYATWQRDWLQGDVLEAQLAYWRRQLAGAPPLLNLPTDRPRPAIQTFRGARRLALLPPALAEALRALSRAEGATLFMTLLAGWQALLARYSGQDDIVVGADIAGRTHVGLEGLIGFFVNQLALRTNLAGDPTFRELLGRVREVVLGAYAHQDVPFEKLVEAVQPQRSSSYAPLFQVEIVFQNAPMPSRAEHLTVSFLEVGNQTAKYDLTLFLAENERGIVATLEYSTDLFEAETIGRMLRHFETLLAGIVAQPDARLSRLEIAGEAERQQQDQDRQARRATRLKKLAGATPKAISLTQDEP